MRFQSSSSDRGTVTAELAVGIPAILGLVGIALGGLRWGMDAVTATTVTAETSLAIARGDPVDVLLKRAGAALPSARWDIEKTASTVCVIASIPMPGFALIHQEVRQCSTL